MKRLLAIGLALSLSACGDVPDEVRQAGTAVADLTARELGALAARIFENPAEATDLLESRGLSVERLDSLVYAIARDAEESAEYVLGLTGVDD